MAGFAFLFPHLYDYYKVRVLGHNLVCVYNENKTMSYYIRHRGEKTLPQHDLALVLPISGLFTKPRIISKNDARGWGYPGERWDIKLDVLETDKESLLLSLRDRGGNQIRRTPEVICHILEHFSNVEMGFPKESWGWVLATLLAKEDELKLAQSKIGQLVTAAVADTELLFEAVMQLD
ncbi:MAG: hypothetical protein NTU97_00135, partial [Candidatus Magasanikbacteria bacterium]|nr:hypothetical protein [Candidatus Magasanikbacteria bacterium]